MNYKKGDIIDNVADLKYGSILRANNGAFYIHTPDGSLLRAQKASIDNTTWLGKGTQVSILNSMTYTGLNIADFLYYLEKNYK